MKVTTPLLDHSLPGTSTTVLLFIGCPGMYPSSFESIMDTITRISMNYTCIPKEIVIVCV